MPSHHGTQPGPEEEGLSSVGLLAPAGPALPQFPCVFFSEKRRHKVAHHRVSSGLGRSSGSRQNCLGWMGQHLCPSSPGRAASRLLPRLLR